MPDSVSFADLIDQLDTWRERGVWFFVDKNGLIDMVRKNGADADGAMLFVAHNRIELKAYLMFKDAPQTRSSLEFHRWRYQKELVTA